MSELHRTRLGLREPDAYPSLLGYRSNKLAEADYWVGHFSESFAVESHAEHRGGATSPSRSLSDSSGPAKRPYRLRTWHPVGASFCLTTDNHEPIDHTQQPA